MSVPLVRGEHNYFSDLEVGKGICKRGKNFSVIKPEQIPLGRSVNAAKLKDIAFLLEKHFSDNWKEDGQLAFYKQIVDMHIGGNIRDNENTTEDVCDVLMDDETDHIV